MEGALSFESFIDEDPFVVDEVACLGFRVEVLPHDLVADEPHAEQLPQLVDVALGLGLLAAEHAHHAAGWQLGLVGADDVVPELRQRKGVFKNGGRLPRFHRLDEIAHRLRR